MVDRAMPPREFAKQLRRFAKFIANLEDYPGWERDWGYPEHNLIHEMHGLWNDMLAMDNFGVEGQLDPRGDRRG